MKKILSLLFTAFSLSWAQSSYVNINYQTTMPMGDLMEFMDVYATDGITASYAFVFNDRLALGLDGSRHSFLFHEDLASMNFGAELLEGPSKKYMDISTIHLTGTYFLNLPSALKPSVSAGLGTSYLDYGQQIGKINRNKIDWALSLHAEVAFNIMIAKSAWGLKFAGRYDYTSITNDFFSEMHQASVLAGVIFCPQWKE